MIAALRTVRAAGPDAGETVGTTLTTFYSVSSSGFVFHAGDSRAYLWRQGRLHQITEDQTLVHELVQSPLFQTP